MASLLNLFNQIVFGDLNPINGGEFAMLNVQTELRKQYEEYREQFIVSFQRNDSGTYNLMSHKSYAFADWLHLPRTEKKDYENDPEILSQLKVLTAKALSLDEDKMKELKCQNLNDHITLHFEIKHDWAELSDSKARYHYINHLLIKEVDKIKADFSQKVFSFSNEEALGLFVRNYQNELILLIDSCLYQTKAKEGHEVDQISNHYTKSDILKLTFYYLENLLLYLEHHFSRYLDLKGEIPYQHKMITIYGLSPKVDRLRYKQVV